MAKVAPPSSLPLTSLQIGGGAIKVAKMVKRKTPSELRVSYQVRDFVYKRLPILTDRNCENSFLILLTLMFTTGGAVEADECGRDC